MSKIIAQRWLTAFWFLLIVLSTTLFAFHMPADQKGRDALWQWYSPYVFPTFLLMIGTLVASEVKEEKESSSRAFFFLCLSLIIFYGSYLLIVLSNSFQASAEASSVLHDTSTHLIDSLRAASSWLTGIQSTVTAALGGFFVTKK